MDHRNARMGSLRGLESKGFALKHRLDAIQSVFLLSCLVVLTVVGAAWWVVFKPRGKGETYLSLVGKLKYWGFGGENGEFRGLVIAIVLAAVPVGLTIAGMTWSARARPKSSVLHGEWLQDVVDTVNREMSACFILCLNAYVCGVAVILFWVDALLRKHGAMSILSALFLMTIYLFSASLPALMKIGDGIAISSYAKDLLTLRRVAKWRYFHGVSPRYNVLDRKLRVKWVEVGEKGWFWLSFIFVAFVSGMPGVSLWLSLSLHYTILPARFEWLSLVLILFGEASLWYAVMSAVCQSVQWVRVPGLKLDRTEWWSATFGASIFCIIGVPLQVFGYYMMIQNWWLASLSAIGVNVILELLVWRTLRGHREFSLWFLVLHVVTVAQRKLSKRMIRPLREVDIENYFAVADLIVPEDSVLDGKTIKLRDFINEMMTFDAPCEAEVASE